MSSKKQKLLALSFLVVGAVLLSACGGATPAPEEAAPVPEEAAAPAEPEPIIIGAVFDRKGWMARHQPVKLRRRRAWWGPRPAPLRRSTARKSWATYSSPPRSGTTTWPAPEQNGATTRRAGGPRPS